MKNIKYVLIACEESQTVCSAFREVGAEAYSLDLQECSGGHPEWHIRDFAEKYLQGRRYFKTQDGTIHHVTRWDLIIAHPPCTYLSKASGIDIRKDELRRAHGLIAVEFFQQCLDAKCDQGCRGKSNSLKVLEPTQAHPGRSAIRIWSKLSETYTSMVARPAHTFTNTMGYRSKVMGVQFEKGKETLKDVPRYCKSNGRTMVPTPMSCLRAPVRLPSLRAPKPTGSQAYGLPSLRAPKPTGSQAYGLPSLRAPKPTGSRPPPCCTGVLRL